MAEQNNGVGATSLPAGLIAMWMLAAAGAAAISQVIRLQHTGPASWLFWDYAGRLTVLLLLALHPAVRSAVFRFQRPQVSIRVAVTWGLLFVPIMSALWLAGRIYAGFLPEFRLGSYPRPQGWLLFFDVTVGLALVAFHEEIFFRRAMSLALSKLGDGAAMILLSGVLFGAYHWWTGVPNMINAAGFGIAAMWIYRKIGALWPLVVIHYLTDLWYFI
jgi:uncharacterized protein